MLYDIQFVMLKMELTGTVFKLKLIIIQSVYKIDPCTVNWKAIRQYNS